MVLIAIREAGPDTKVDQWPNATGTFLFSLERASGTTLDAHIWAGL